MSRGGELTILCASGIKSDVCRFSHSKVEEKHKAIPAQNTQSYHRSACYKWRNNAF